MYLFSNAEKSKLKMFNLYWCVFSGYKTKQWWNMFIWQNISLNVTKSEKPYSIEEEFILSIISEIQKSVLYKSVALCY